MRRGAAAEPRDGARNDSPRAQRHTDDVLLLARTPFGESSLVVHALARRAGRVHLMARGAYRPTSGYFALLDLFDTLELTWRARPGHELGELAGGRLAARRRRIVRSLDAYRAALGVLELLDLAARPGVPAARLLATAEAALDALDLLGAAPEEGGGDARAGIDLVRAAFDLAFLDELGLAPALLACASCGRAAPTGAAAARTTAFAPAAGGRLCRACAERVRAEGASVAAVESALVEIAAALLAHARERGFAALEPALPPGTLTAARRRALVALAQRFLEHHLELRPRSRAAPPA